MLLISFKSFSTMKIIGIDVGLVNLGVAQFDTATQRTTVDVWSLLNPENKHDGTRYKYAESFIPFLIQKFILHHAETFAAADLIVIEQQVG